MIGFPKGARTGNDVKSWAEAAAAMRKHRSSTGRGARPADAFASWRPAVVIQAMNIRAPRFKRNFIRFAESKIEMKFPRATIRNIPRATPKEAIPLFRR
ncbi:hypothetical protein [uncultured Rikenella sp.]|uniref:hypothetical protein n=1 Tax=uncultured Rikenella sp. TaxID=368003 RepID=UPI0025FEE678|nr:hypothetical protein [uncultured Rikenella sp.]